MRFRNYPVLTDTYLTHLPKFDKKVSMHKIFDILCIKLRDTKLDRVKKRTTGNKCPIDDCTYKKIINVSAIMQKLNKKKEA